MKRSTYPSLTERANHYDLKGAAEQGLLLADVSAVLMEEALLSNEYDLSNRARLLAYYYYFARGNEEREKARIGHILWFIRNIPACAFAGDVYLSVDKAKYKTSYQIVKAAWKRQMSQVDCDVQTKINAAIFLWEFDSAEARKILKTLEKRCPGNEWVRALLGRNRLEVTNAFDTIDSTKLIELLQFANEHLQSQSSMGSTMPPISAETLETVVSRHPEDLCSRASLIGYYVARVERKNILGCDPYASSRLASHLVYLIKTIPACNFLAQFTDYRVFSTKTCPFELQLLRDVWSTTLKVYPDDPHVLASAACFNASIGRMKTADKFEVLARKYSKNKNVIDELMNFGVENARRQRRFKQPSKRKGKRSLDSVAARDVSFSVARKRFEEFSLLEWSREVDLSGANLEGSYNWFHYSSVENLETILESDSLDIYNRARIIGCYGRDYYDDEPVTDTSQLFLYGGHVKWFIENIPESDYIVLFNLEVLKKNLPAVYELCKTELLKQLDRQPASVMLLVNTILVLSKTEREFANSLIGRLDKLDVAWAARVRYCVFGENEPINATKFLSSVGFRPGVKSVEISKAAKILRFTYYSLFGRRLAARSAWTHEQVLRGNPNDLVLRAEVVGLYEYLDGFSTYLCGQTPTYLAQLISHHLWLIEVIPDVFLYSLSGDLSLSPASENSREHVMGAQDVLLEAVRLQMKKYPKIACVHVSLIHYFPYWAAGAAIKALRPISRLYPKHVEIKSRLKHLKYLNR